MKRWTRSDLTTALKLYCQGLGYKRIAQLTGRRLATIRSAIRPYRKWRQAGVEFALAAVEAERALRIAHTRRGGGAEEEVSKALGLMHADSKRSL